MPPVKFKRGVEAADDGTRTKKRREREEERQRVGPRGPPGPKGEKGEQGEPGPPGTDAVNYGDLTNGSANLNLHHLEATTATIGQLGVGTGGIQSTGAITTGEIRGSNVNNDLIFKASDGAQIARIYNGSNEVRIGVNPYAPSSKLHVDGTITAGHIMTNPNSNYNSTGTLVLADPSTSTTATLTASDIEKLGTVAAYATEYDDEDARGAVSASTSGAGSLTYDRDNGVFTYNGDGIVTTTDDQDVGGIKTFSDTINCAQITSNTSELTEDTTIDATMLSNGLNDRDRFKPVIKINKSTTYDRNWYMGVSRKDGDNSTVTQLTFATEAEELIGGGSDEPHLAWALTNGGRMTTRKIDASTSYYLNNVEIITSTGAIQNITSVTTTGDINTSGGYLSENSGTSDFLPIGATVCYEWGSFVSADGNSGGWGYGTKLKTSDSNSTRSPQQAYRLNGNSASSLMTVSTNSSKELSIKLNSTTGVEGLYRIQAHVEVAYIGTSDRTFLGVMAVYGNDDDIDPIVGNRSSGQYTREAYQERSVSNLDFMVGMTGTNEVTFNTFIDNQSTQSDISAFSSTNTETAPSGSTKTHRIIITWTYMGKA